MWNVHHYKCQQSTKAVNKYVWKALSIQISGLSDNSFFFNTCWCSCLLVHLINISFWCYLGDMLSVKGDADAAVDRIQIGWNKFRQLVPLLTNRDISLIRRGRLYSSCVRSSMLHRSETWPVRKENEVALQWAEIRMVRWMCNVKVKDRVPSKELRERLGVDDINWYYSKTGCNGMGMCCERRHWLGEEMYGIWGGGLQTKR